MERKVLHLHWHQCLLHTSRMPVLPKRSSEDVDLIGAQAPRGADSQSQNIKISLWQQETTWSLTQSVRANFSMDNSSMFLCSPSFGFIPVAQRRQGREQAAWSGAELFCSRWDALQQPDSCTSVLGSPLLKTGTKAWSSVPISGEQPNSQHPVCFEVTLKSTQWEMTSIPFLYSNLAYSREQSC